jgi:hypothetical protein
MNSPQKALLSQSLSNSESITQRSEIRVKKGEGLKTNSPNPSPSVFTNPLTLQREVWQILIGGLHSLSLNDYGRPWPNPRRDVLAGLLAKHDRDLCVKAAWDAREIVQSQDRAPNITTLFAKKLEEAAEVRSTVRDALGAA